MRTTIKIEVEFNKKHTKNRRELIKHLNDEHIMNDLINCDFIKIVRVK